ncbi:MAG: signal recognition particle-docking protein FtsY [Alphaproteobacteria bacterium 41-28]|nr:MAG: signal recognition particle-docking protein FtsY [Alphaproteobacteria bacterium 41-28]
MTSWFTRLKDGLKKSSTRITEGITTLVTHRKLDDETLEELEELLITSDLGVSTAADLIQKLKKKKYNQNITTEEIRAAFAEEIEPLLAPYALPLIPKGSSKPYVVLVLGVNGSGKTTTIGKLAKQWKDQGYQLSLVAGDTFRAAATEQLEVWAKRANVPLETAPDKDAAGLVYDAFKRAKERNDDIVMIDTAGRLHNKAVLMEELKKIHRVIQKIDPAAPHATLLVLDATTGQNALTQVKVFQEAVNVSGLIVTKLDGTAKGGVLVAITQQFGLPVHAIGVGESIEDLHAFSAKDFAENLMGISKE